MDGIDVADLKYLSFAEWISGDYNDFVKKTVLPVFSKKYPLKLRETRVLNSIASSEYKTTASDVSENLRQDPATITRSLVILIGKGYIVSGEDIHDGRSRLLKPTDLGLEAHNCFLRIFKESIDQIVDNTGVEKFEFDDNSLTRSLELVALRAKAFRESQRDLARWLRGNNAPSFI